MRDIPINNPEVLDGLNNFLWMYKERDEIKKHHQLHSQEFLSLQKLDDQSLPLQRSVTQLIFQVFGSDPFSTSHH